VLLVHLSGPKAAWQFSSGSVAVDTQDSRRHQLTDAVAIPGGMTSKMVSRNQSSRVADDGIVIHTSGKIYLGGGSTSPVARNTDVQDALISALTDPNVINAIVAYPPAAIINAPAALAALTVVINTHFSSQPVAGSDIVEAE
jgi:hypothetical protein